MVALKTSGLLNVESASPEQKLVAAVLLCALTDARGQGETRRCARQWLRECSHNWLAYLAPDGTDIEELHDLVLEMVGERRA